MRIGHAWPARTRKDNDVNTNAIFVAMQCGIPVLLWGGPGVGKTSFTNSIASYTKRFGVTVIASIREPSDFSGLPVILDSPNDTQLVRLAPPAWAHELIEHKGGILFLDELSTAPPTVQAALLRVILERQVGEVKLPDDTWIIAAANPVDTSSGTWLLSAALANRMLHIDWNVDVDAWIKGMIEGFGIFHNLTTLPDDWRDGIPAARNLVASFIRHKPTMLYNRPEDIVHSGRAWPSPRTWDMASTVHAACNAAKLSKDDELGLLSATVGEGAAIEYHTWWRSLDLVEPSEALAHQDTVKFPKRSDQVFAMLVSIVTYAKPRMNENIWDASWVIMGRAAVLGHADLAALPARMLAETRTEKLKIPVNVKEFIPILLAAGLLK